MEKSDSSLKVTQLIKGPALIAIAVTIVRLFGELSGGSSAFFGREAGGQASIVGIVWLIPIFGVYFAIKLVRGAHAPERAGRVIGFALLGLVVAVAIIVPVFAFTGDPAAGISLGAAIVQQLGVAVASLVAILILRKAWPAFFRTILGYAFASRVPVVVVTGIALAGNLATHYNAAPPGYPEMGFLGKFIMLAVIPQMTFWIMVTVVFGTLFGGIAAALLPSRGRMEEPL